jgi:succinyl-diaminopimelate desuccinylase
MKAGVAVMIELLDSSAATEGPFDLVCVFYDKEEGPTDENGLEAVLDGLPWLMDAAVSIVMEPTDLNLEFGCNGVMNADIVFQGSSGHAARPWLGVNAVTRGGAWLAEMDEREPDPVDIGGLVYREVFSVTQAHGGIANNIIPPTFTINLNYRFPPVYSVDEAEVRLRSVAAAADEIRIKDSAPAGLVHVDHPLIDRLEELIGRERMAKQGWTDVARLTARGAVAVNYGPGEASQAHQVGESMPIANLDIVLGVMKQFLAG